MCWPEISVAPPPDFHFETIFPVVFPENALAQTGFSKKMVRGGRPKFLATPCVLTESSSKMILGSGALQSAILSFFLDFRSQKFRPLGKKRVFREVDFFEKTTKTTVLFFRGALIFSQKKRVYLTGFRFKL